MREMQLLIGGCWRDAVDSFVVRSPFDGREVARVGRAGEKDLHAALDAAWDARSAMAALPPHRRAGVLETAAAEVLARREELAAVLVEEAGKPIALARTEVERCAETLGDAARVARSPASELIDLGGPLPVRGGWDSSAASPSASSSASLPSTSR